MMASCSWPVRSQVLRVVVWLTMLVLLLGIYQSCTSPDSVWLSFSFVGSRPFFLLAPELPSDGQQRPTTDFQTAPSPSSYGREDATRIHPSLNSSVSSETMARTGSTKAEGARSAPTNEVDDRGDSWVGVADPDLKENTALPPSEEIPKGSKDLNSGISEDLDLQNGSTTPFARTRIIKYLEELEKSHPSSKKTELELLAAKLAIQAATVNDADATLYGLLYDNVSAFSLSYKLMEELFRVYVYKDGSNRFVRNGSLTGIYASEGQFIDKIIGSCFEEDDPERAHMFFLPYSVAEMVLSLYVPDSQDMHPLINFVTDYVNNLARTYPFWNRTEGADHFFVACHDWGPATARDQQQLRNNSVKVVCNADMTEEFVVGKDASLPEVYVHNLKPLKVGGPVLSKRAFLAFFAGQMHGHVRPVLIQHWKDKDSSMRIYEEIPRNISRRMNYVQHMKNSKYCICPAGFEVNSPRIVEAIYYDCVPVIIADNFVLPFSDVLNWDAFSLTLPESEIPNLKTHLLNIPEKSYRSMQRRLSKIRQHFLWHQQPVKYDAFHMTLHSVWMSRLNHIHL
ncbi:xylogalacturonan beta-1,3-xylosyltransferase [Marchantia polymorpha subsp. ruderalis]|uniref:Exostosin GT47 domain-containing protein n=2 Tax=Marchantia polymorpha TaxID=3197 RepID=A0A176VEG2_MARPO|nr:hypothetical protein AXG93_4751s1260 [Marchantia polymorpha subsp. ruderalis]PTQ28571.1 hypothetical protein MARPO_0160s0021 [Marchantia polymorpha]BBN06451.1 hypothetical protein Mp_3g21260 [Marchantia polymorpha subsp. ruderalis]|eukprot:PTQ28571.1 hypothetical protein MARPO_0160s0021 [Marchantia polymorpha]